MMAKDKDRVNWARFFSEMEQAVTPEPGQSSGERATQIIQMADKYGSTTTLDEFVSKFGGEIPAEDDE